MHFDFVHGLSADTREKTDRESPRIAFPLRSGALLRLIAYAAIARLLENCYWKNRRAGFPLHNRLI